MNDKDNRFVVEISDEDYYRSNNIDKSKQKTNNKIPKKRKKHKLLKAIIGLIIGITVFFSLFVFVISAFSGYSKGDKLNNGITDKSTLVKSPAVTNILLIGVDSGAEENSRSDSVILVSVDFAHFKIKITSFLRDTWVEIPTKGSFAKLNAACAYGGPSLLVDTLEYNFGIDISHYVMVDFEMFVKIIDKLGGIDVEVTKAESDFINRTTRQTVSYGDSVHLNGEEALVYARIRKLDSDFMRTYRQRKIINSLIRKAKKTSPVNLISLAGSIFPLIETDMNPAQITFLAQKCAVSVPLFSISQSRVPTDAQARDATINGQSVIKADLYQCRRYLYNYIYTNKIEPEE